MTNQFVELTLNNGEQRMVNVSEIRSVQETDEKVTIILRDDKALVATAPTYAQWRGGDVAHVFSDGRSWATPVPAN